jgi:hypothetical protein
VFPSALHAKGQRNLCVPPSSARVSQSADNQSVLQVLHMHGCVGALANLPASRAPTGFAAFLLTHPALHALAPSSCRGVLLSDLGVLPALHAFAGPLALAGLLCMLPQLRTLSALSTPFVLAASYNYNGARSSAPRQASRRSSSCARRSRASPSCVPAPHTRACGR